MAKTREDSVARRQAGIWIRVSTDDQARGDSPEHHEQRGRFYAASKGWEVVDVYNLAGVSGKSVRGHPETERMLEDVKKGRIGALIFSKLARLARNVRELLDFADLFRDHGADLVSLDESIDTTTPAGRLFYTMIGAMAQWEREEIGARTAASVKVRAQLGKFVGGKAPFGYQWLDKKLVPHPDEAAVVRRMYDLFATHRRKRTVARLLNESGHRTRGGAKFTDTTVRRLLSDPTFKGLHRVNYTKSVGGKAWAYKPAEEWTMVPVEPVVSEDLWTQVNAILDGQRKEGARRPGKKTVHLFSGLVWCECGQKMYVPSNSPKYTCFKCRNKITVEDLEAVFNHELQRFLLSPERTAHYLDDAKTSITDKETQLRTLENDRRKVAEEIDELFRLYHAKEIQTQGFGRRHQPLDERLKQLEDRIPELQAEIDFMKVEYLSGDEILAEARDLSTRLPEMPPEEKRQIVESITERITVGKDGVEINLWYLPAAAPRSPSSHSDNAANRQRSPACSSPRRRPRRASRCRSASPGRCRPRRGAGTTPCAPPPRAAPRGPSWRGARSRLPAASGGTAASARAATGRAVHARRS